MTMEKTEKFLAINRKLEVRLDGDESRYYKSSVLGVQGKLFLINPPYRGKNDLLLHVGDKLEVVLLSDKEKYLFTAAVLQRVTAPLKGYVLEAADEAKRIQLRAFVRIKVAIEAEWVRLPEGVLNKKDFDNIKFSKAVMADLSGGGASLTLGELLPEETRILVRFPLEIQNKVKTFTIPAEVRRSYSRNEKNKFVAGVNFFGISEKERDQIIEYVFYRQRKERFLDGEQE